MITKIHTSRNIAATINYVMNPTKRAEVILSKGIFSMHGAENIAREFETRSALRPQAKTKLLHVPMSFHVRDRERMESDGAAIVREWLRRMERFGFRFDQYIVVRHHDQDHKNPHFHLVINLTLEDGCAVKTSYIGKYAKLASIEVTHNWGMVAADRSQRPESEERPPQSRQSADRVSARSASLYAAGDTFTNEEPIGTDGIGTGLAPDIGGAIMELLLQPTIVHTGGGGGSSEEEDEKRHKDRRKRFRR